MFHKFHFCFSIILLINGLMTSSIFSQTCVINGTLATGGQETDIKDCIIRKESLAIKDKRVYIQLLIDQGARKITERNRYRNLSFLLPEEVIYDDVSERIFYYKGNTEIEIGRKKSFLGFMP